MSKMLAIINGPTIQAEEAPNPEWESRLSYLFNETNQLYVKPIFYDNVDKMLLGIQFVKDTKATRSELLKLKLIDNFDWGPVDREAMMDIALKAKARHHTIAIHTELQNYLSDVEYNKDYVLTLLNDAKVGYMSALTVVAATYNEQWFKDNIHRIIKKD